MNFKQLNESIENFALVGPRIATIDPVTDDAINASQQRQSDIDRELKATQVIPEDELKNGFTSRHKDKKITSEPLKKMGLSENKKLSSLTEEKHVIYKENGRYKETVESNYNSRIMNARRVHDLSDFDSAEEIINYYNHHFGTTKDDFIIKESCSLKEVKDDQGVERYGINGKWWYFTTHGVQPGSVPKGIKILNVKDGKNSKGTTGTFFCSDRVLNTSELKKYDIKEEVPTGLTESVSFQAVLDELDKLTSKDKLSESVSFQAVLDEMDRLTGESNLSESKASQNYKRTQQKNKYKQNNPNNNEEDNQNQTEVEETEAENNQAEEQAKREAEKEAREQESREREAERIARQQERKQQQLEKEREERIQQDKINSVKSAGKTAASVAKVGTVPTQLSKSAKTGLNKAGIHTSY